MANSSERIGGSLRSVPSIGGSSSSSLNGILDSVYQPLHPAYSTSVGSFTPSSSWSKGLRAPPPPPLGIEEVLRERLCARYTSLVQSHPLNTGKVQLSQLAPALYKNNYAASLHDLQLHSKVLVKGPPSSGKTMLCYKLILDWLQTKSDLLVYVDLASATNSLAKSICSGLKLKQSQITAHLASNRFTLVLDGLEAVNDKQILQEIEAVLNGTTYKYCQTIVTSTRELGPGIGTFYLETFKVKGLSISTVRRTSQKYIDCNRVVDQITKMEIVKDPYLLLQVIAVYERFGTVPSKLSALYMMIGEILNVSKYFESLGKMAVKRRFHARELSADVRRTGLVVVKGGTFRFINDSFCSFATACFVKHSPLCSSASPQVLCFVLEMLDEGSYNVLSKLNRFKYDTVQKLKFLQASGPSDRNVDAICSLFTTKTTVIHIQSNFIAEYKRILSHPNCRLESVELVICPGYPINRIIDGLVLNRHIKCVKISSVPGQDWNELDVALLANQILRLMQNKNIDNLELSFTLLEDKEHFKFQPFIEVVAFNMSNLSSLGLDLDLTGDQVQVIVDSIDYIDEISLLHLGCGYAGFQGIISLIDKCNHLNISGAWRTGTEPLEACPGSLQKRSLVQRSRNLRTVCNALEHVNGFHVLFTSLKGNNNLGGLDLSKSVMGYADFTCLGECIRFSCLRELTLEGMKFADLVQVLLNLNSSSVKKLSIGSSHCVLLDEDWFLLRGSVKNLDTLSIGGWTVTAEAFGFDNIKELDISFCKLYLNSVEFNSRLEKLVMNSTVVKINGVCGVEEMFRGSAGLNYLDAANTGISVFKASAYLNTLVLSKNSFKSVKDLKLSQGLKKLYLNNAIFADGKDCRFLSRALCSLEYLEWNGVDTSCISALKSITPRTDCVFASDNLSTFVDYFESNRIAFEYCDQGVMLKKAARKSLF